MARGKARELAFRTLFQSARGDLPLLEVWQQVSEDLKENQDKEVDEVFIEGFDQETQKFAEELITSYEKNKEDIDNSLIDALDGWSFTQMVQTDLNVLRIAIAEIMHFDEIPKEVTTEMAIRLAKKYGGEESGRFVNGVLSKYLRATAV